MKSSQSTGKWRRQTGREEGREEGREGGRELGAAVVAQMKLWQQSQLTRVAPAAAAAECRVLSADRTVSAECGLHQVALLTHTCRKKREVYRARVRERETHTH